MVKENVPNDRLRRVRERLFGTQQALADAANELLAPAYLMTANDVGKLERGVVEQPSAPRREALRAVCRVATDADIGLVRGTGHRAPGVRPGIHAPDPTASLTVPAGFDRPADGGTAS